MSDTVVQQSILNQNRKDKFLLVLNIPNALKGIISNSRNSNNIELDTLQYTVYGNVIPDSVINAVNLPYSGQTTKFTTGVRDAYANVTVSFDVNNTFANWWVLWKWLNLINNAEESIADSEGLTGFPKFADVPYKTAKTTNLQPYQTKITVYGLDEYNVKKIQFDYTNAFITQLKGINYNYRDAAVIESSFTFAFGQLHAQLI